jgi:outer membrane protein assembly factor BamD
MKKAFFIHLFLFIVILSACSKFQKIVKDPNWKVRYEAAIKYYEKGDYYRAGALLDDLVPILIGTVEAEKARFYLAYCYFKQGQYIMSADKFKQFHDTYNRSEFAEEALYMYAYSQYMESPTTNLDQANTDIAINAFQEFINRYPSSNYAKEASGMILELRYKLEQKAYNVAGLYQKLIPYRTDYSKASVIAYENFRKEYPDSKLQEEAAYHKIESQYILAQNSYYTKQQERYQEVVDLYQAFLEKYPKSPFLKKTESMYESARKKLSNIQSQQQKIAKPNTAQSAGSN